MKRLALLLWLAGCVGPIDPGDGGAPDAGSWAEGVFELGGESADGGVFIAFPAEAEAAAGAQGGFHLPVMYRVTGEAVPGVTFEHKVRRASDGTLVSRGTRTLDVGPVATGAPWTTPIVIFLCPTPVGVNVVGEALSFEVTATKGGALLGTARASTVFRCPAGNAFCDSICRG